MSREPLVLDLDADDPDQAGGRVRLRQIAVPLWGVVLVAIGVAVVAVGFTRSWDAAQSRRAQQETVAILVGIPDDATLIGQNGAAGVTYRSEIQVINSGPLPIEVGRIAASSGGVTVVGDAKGRVVPTGDVRRMDVSMQVDCPARVENEPVEMRLDVETADGMTRPKIIYLPLTNTVWDGLC